MPLKLPRLDRSIVIVKDIFTPSLPFHQWWDRVCNAIEVAFANLEGMVLDIQAAQDAAAAAQAAADDAQAAADAAQATADSIVVPPNGVINVTTNTTLGLNDVTVNVDASGGAVDITLIAAFDYTVPVYVTKTDASGNLVSVYPSGGDTLNTGPGPVALAIQNERHGFTSNGVDSWFG